MELKGWFSVWVTSLVPADVTPLSRMIFPKCVCSLIIGDKAFAGLSVLIEIIVLNFFPPFRVVCEPA